MSDDSDRGSSSVVLGDSGVECWFGWEEGVETACIGNVGLEMGVDVTDVMVLGRDVVRPLFAARGGGWRVGGRREVGRPLRGRRGALHRSEGGAALGSLSQRLG